MEPINCRETSVRNYHHSLRNNPEERQVPLELTFNVHFNIILLIVTTSVKRSLSVGRQQKDKGNESSCIFEHSSVARVIHWLLRPHM